MFKRFWWVFLVMAVATPLLGLLISATITYVMPKKFESTATLYFPLRSLVITKVGEVDKEWESHAAAIKDHIQAMQGDEVLLKVAENLELPNKWGYGKMQILQQLRKVIQIVQLRESDLVEIRVRHTNKEDARDIAAELVRSYQKQLSENDKVEFQPERRLARLKAMIPEQEKIVDQLEQELKAARKSLADNPVARGVEDRTQLEKQKEYESAQTKLGYSRLMIKDPATFKMLDEPMSQNSMIVQEEPRIGQIPVSPNVRFNLLTGVAGGLVLSPLFSLPLIWLLHTAFRKKAALPV